MSLNNDQVKSRWINGKSGKNSKRNLYTDGRSLWSYRMLIGITLDTGEKCILSLSGDCRVSATTQRHARNIYDVPTRSWLARDVTPVLNPYAGHYLHIYDTWVFPIELLDHAGNPQALASTDAIISL